ncbi:MAG: hypothetical protein OQK69_10670 [Gammaproteobacteria bacterium]|nr:hypothetical protein [Gammaproteobacteria bacterium]
MYYIFEGSITYIDDSAGLAAQQNLTIGRTFTTIFLVDTTESGTSTSLSMYPIYNQKYTQIFTDTTYANGITKDYFFTDLISLPLINGSAWGDRGTIEENNGYFLTNTGTQNQFHLLGSNSPTTTGAITELTAYYQQVSELTIGKEFNYSEVAATNDGGTYLKTTLYGTATLVDIFDNITTEYSLVFNDIINEALNNIFTSNIANITDITTSVNISIIGGEYSINGGAWTSAPGTVSNLSPVLLRQTSAATGSTQTDAVLTIGGVSATFSVTTRP